MERNNIQWWQSGIIYQVYPRSFQDSNGDGIGDLKGIIQRLDYLQWLEVSAIWISPVYPSPMADFGYDISDYKDIHPLFGSLQDFDELLQQAHARGLKVILDMVPNHTSDQHPWFLESKSSRDNPKRGWYIWKDAKADGSPPNNWLSVFGGTAWEWDDTTGQYYYHAFLKEQPDLNWRNPAVQNAMMDVMRFWLERGVDGFRVDVMWHMIKDEKLRDNPVNPSYQPHMATYEQVLPVYSTDQPEVHDIVQQMRRVLDAYPDRMMIGEIYLPIHKLVTYYGVDNKGAHLPFNFMLLSLPWEAQRIAAAIDEYEGALPANAWPNWVLGNHDQPRITSRVGLQQSKVAAILLLTLRGTPTIYYGEELGMQDVPIPFEEVQDPQGLNMPDKNLSRDPCRTPMQWDKSVGAGFTTGNPWLRLSAASRRVNVEVQKDVPWSHLSLYRRLIKLRQSQPSLMWGDYQPILADQQAFAYMRKTQGEKAYLIVLNLSHRPCYLTIHQKIKGRVVLSASSELEGTFITERIQLSGDEGIIVEIDEME
jgi:alpha-glucosidase